VLAWSREDPREVFADRNIDFARIVIFDGVTALYAQVFCGTSSWLVYLAGRPELPSVFPDDIWPRWRWIELEEVDEHV